MAIATYSDLKVALADLLIRQDLTDDELSTFTGLAEGVLSTWARDTHMVGTNTLSIAANGFQVSVPAAFQEPEFAQVSGDMTKVLQLVSPERLGELRTWRMKLPGTPRFYAIIGRQLHIAPATLADISISLSYYQKLPALRDDSDTNWLLNSRPDLYLYTMAMIASLLLQEPEAAGVYQGMLPAQVGQLIAQNAAATMGETPPVAA